MNRQYPEADDLWQDIMGEQDPVTRRELLVQMSRLTLELEDARWVSDESSVDSTNSLLDYQAIAKLVTTNILQAMPMLDPYYKGESLEEEFHNDYQELISLDNKIMFVKQQQLKVIDQSRRLTLQHDSLKKQQEQLEVKYKEITSLKQTITLIEEVIDYLKSTLNDNDFLQQKHITQLLEDFNPTLQKIFHNYQNLIQVWSLNLDENYQISNALNLLIKEEDKNILKKIYDLNQTISTEIKQYDRLLSKLINFSQTP